MKNRKLNGPITKRVIELQDQGYLFDFQISDKKVICLQDSVCFGEPDVSIKLIDQVYDQFSHSYKYIHSVETSTGYRGLMLEEGIYAN